jgi:hypothetical protein
MTRCSYLFAVVFVLIWVGIAGAQQYPIMNMIADQVIQKYQSMTCEQLWQHKGQPKTAQEQEMIQMLRANPQMRHAFIEKVAPAIVNKMFDCGMVP